MRFDCVAIEFTEHAVEAVNRRVFRMLDLEAAEQKLNRLAAERGRVSSERPAWLHHRRSSRAAAWLVIDQPRMCFPLYGDAPSGSVLAGTCLTPEHAPTGAAVRWRDEPANPTHRHRHLGATKRGDFLLRSSRRPLHEEPGVGRRQRRSDGNLAVPRMYAT